MENPDPRDKFFSRRRWLARLAFSFALIALFLVYTGYRGSQDHTMSQLRVILCYFAAMLSFVLFMLGVRERHR